MSFSIIRACEDTEVDLIAEELVVVLEKTGTGWWYVQAKSGTGWAPNHFLKVPTGLMDENPKVFLVTYEIILLTSSIYCLLIPKSWNPKRLMEKGSFIALKTFPSQTMKTYT